MYIPIGVSPKAKTRPVDWVLRHASAKPEHCSRKTPNGMQTIATGYRFMSWCRTWGCQLQVHLLVLGEDQSWGPSARSVVNRERWANRIIWRTLSRLSTSRKAWHHWTNYIHIWISLIAAVVLHWSLNQQVGYLQIRAESEAHFYKHQPQMK